MKFYVAVRGRLWLGVKGVLTPIGTKPSETDVVLIPILASSPDEAIEMARDRYGSREVVVDIDGFSLLPDHQSHPELPEQ